MRPEILDTYNRYIHSPEWKKVRAERLKKDNEICQVCGRPAAEVHHLTYANFGHENMSDLVSLCRQCHEKAEYLADDKRSPCIVGKFKSHSNFMAALRIDARDVAENIYDYLKKVRGSNFESLMALREPPEGTKDYWATLRMCVNALCQKRYLFCSVEDRLFFEMDAVETYTEALCVSEILQCTGAIEHQTRNMVQADLKKMAVQECDMAGGRKEAADRLGIGLSTLDKLKNDRGSYGPSLREELLTLLLKDAAYGNLPEENFMPYLAPEDFKLCCKVAEYVASVSGDGPFKGEYDG